MEIIGLTFIKQCLCPHFVGYIFFSSHRHDFHATYCKQCNLTNKPHFGINLGVPSPVSFTIGIKHINLQLKLALLPQKSFYFPLDLHESQLYGLMNSRKELELIYYLNSTKPFIIG